MITDSKGFDTSGAILICGQLIICSEALQGFDIAVRGLEIGGRATIQVPVGSIPNKLLPLMTNVTAVQALHAANNSLTFVRSRSCVACVPRGKVNCVVVESTGPMASI